MFSKALNLVFIGKGSKTVVGT